jgi:vacuolar protein sorting-associated protein 13A/C
MSSGGYNFSFIIFKEELKLKIPWKSLYTESVKATIDGLTILVAPKSSVVYDAEREKKENRDSKLKQVKRLIELETNKLKAKIEEEASKNPEGDSFTERIQIQIVRNLELTIKNIHIRYEDDFSKPEHPFSAGVTLDAIEIRVRNPIVFFYNQKYCFLILKSSRLNLNS